MSRRSVGRIGGTCDDERAAALRAAGAEVVVGDLTNGSDVARALGVAGGCISV
jgi:hypothetical protein